MYVQFVTKCKRVNSTIYPARIDFLHVLPHAVQSSNLTNHAELLNHMGKFDMLLTLAFSLDPMGS